MSTVYLRKFTDAEEAFRLAWNDIVSTVDSPIRSVLLKPNFINDLPADKGVTTSFPLIDRVIAFLKERDVTTIALGEASIMDTDTVFNSFSLNSYTKKGIDVINLEKCGRVTVSSPLGISNKNFSIPQPILDFDLIINMPKLKTHTLTGVSLGLKNLFAFFSRAARKYAHVTDIDLAIVDMFAYIKSVKPVLTIMDAIVAMSGERGPIHGTPVPLDMVITGADAVAVDSAAIEIMGGRWKDIKHVALAGEHNLCETAFEVDSSDIPVESIKQHFTIPEPSLHLKAKLVNLKNSIFIKRPCLISPDNCTQCKACVTICPRDCITLIDTTIRIDYTNCVRCLCCCEACKYNAMGHFVRFGTLYQFLLFLRKLVGK